MKNRSLVNYTPGWLSSRWQGLGGLSDIFDEMDRMWNQFDVKTFTDLQPAGKFPKINVAETDDKYEVEIAVAGFDREDVELELKDNCLCVKADRKEEVKEEDKKYLVREISSRSFRRALQFPKKVLTNDIECRFEDGVITCVLAKEPEKQIEDDTIKIDIQ
jgi:HSP20 family molecular chaperone IbpA